MRDNALYDDLNNTIEINRIDIGSLPSRLNLGTMTIKGLHTHTYNIIYSLTCHILHTKIILLCI